VLVIVYGSLLVIVATGTMIILVLLSRRKRHLAALQPHERWPEILNWQSGDLFETKKWKYGYIQMISLTANGYVVCQTDDDDKPLQTWGIEQLVGLNINLHQRNRKTWVAESSAYMETLDEINKAKLEIQQRDRLNGTRA